MSPPTQYRLYGRRFLQVKRPNQQYQSTEVLRCNFRGEITLDHNEMIRLLSSLARVMERQKGQMCTGHQKLDPVDAAAELLNLTPSHVKVRRRHFRGIDPPT